MPQRVALENGFVRQKGNLSEPRDRRDRRFRSGGDDGAARPDFATADDDRAGAGKARLAAYHFDTELLESLDGVVGRDGVDDRTYVSLNALEINDRLCID